MFTRVFCRRRSAFIAIKCTTYASTVGETTEHIRTAYGIVRAAKLSPYVPSGIRHFSSSTDISCLLTESEFHLIADETLEELVSYLDMLESSSDDFEVDFSVSCSIFLRRQCLIARKLFINESFNSTSPSFLSLQSGVLNISMTSKDISWVINKQTPNRQLWWSSPLR